MRAAPLEDAYRIQDALHRLIGADGRGEIAGWKIALTSRPWRGRPTSSTTASSCSGRHMIVMTGSRITTKFPVPGDRVRFAIDGLGEVALEVTRDH